MLEQDEITDTKYYFTEDPLIVFLKATQKETFESLETDCGTDARDEIFKALKDELRISPLWLIIRHGLAGRGLEFISLADFLADTGNRRILGKGRKTLRIDQTKTMRLISIFGLIFSCPSRNYLDISERESMRLVPHSPARSGQYNKIQLSLETLCCYRKSLLFT